MTTTWFHFTIISIQLSIVRPDPGKKRTIGIYLQLPKPCQSNMKRQLFNKLCWHPKRDNNWYLTSCQSRNLWICSKKYLNNISWKFSMCILITLKWLDYQIVCENEGVPKDWWYIEVIFGPPPWLFMELVWVILHIYAFFKQKHAIMQHMFFLTAFTRINPNSFKLSKIGRLLAQFKTIVNQLTSIFMLTDRGW